MYKHIMGVCATIIIGTGFYFYSKGDIAPFMLLPIAGLAQITVLAMIAQEKLGHPGILWAGVVIALDAFAIFMLDSGYQQGRDEYSFCVRMTGDIASCQQHLPGYGISEGAQTMTEALFVYGPVTAIVLMMIHTWPKKAVRATAKA